eukprot:scaffold179468_cov33-Tisochrysis_lutea.AAC.3
MARARAGREFGRRERHPMIKIDLIPHTRRRNEFAKSSISAARDVVFGASAGLLFVVVPSSNTISCSHAC